MKLPAARDSDLAACPHGPASIDASSTRGIQINNRKAATLNSRCNCMVSSGYVTLGSATVLVNHRPAARMTATTTDGTIIIGSGNVLVGGPNAGGAVGSISEQTDACKQAAAGRTSGSTSQSYGNCGLEAWRNAINAQRQAEGKPPLTEDELLAEAHKNGWAGNNPGKHDHGASSSPGRVAMLDANGIPAESTSQSVDAVRDAVLQGKGVSVHVHPYWWGPYVKPDPDNPSSWAHEVAVTGVELDENGKVVAFIINDTGTGECGKRIPVSDFDKALEKKGAMTVTKQPIW